MPYVLPSFPLSINIWHEYSTGSNNYEAPDVVTVCNLSPGKRVMVNGTISHTGLIFTYPMEILLPKLTDIRPFNNGIASDVCEVPAGSGRTYLVQYVDDIGKGFANEHRFALCYMTFDGLNFADVGDVPYPIPLP
jgi:hypothetical protein